MDLKELSEKIDSEKPYITYEVGKGIIECMLQLSKELEDLKHEYKIHDLREKNKEHEEMMGATQATFRKAGW